MSDGEQSLEKKTAVCLIWLGNETECLWHRSINGGDHEAGSVPLSSFTHRDWLERETVLSRLDPMISNGHVFM